MFEGNHNSSVLTVSPPDSGFSPRREFLRDNHVSSSFALLAIAGSSLVRLSSFPPQLQADLRRAFEVRGILRGIREEKKHNLLEFNIENKPWASSKSVESERLFVDILALIFKHGYKFVSTIDYGREHDDKISIAFSRPNLPSPSSSGPTTIPDQNYYRVPFAVSFPSAKVLRVINPPLNSSPAILQGVRSAWPRGVISEKKPSDRCYEFKLQGYKWFQEDTFATDSLQHILNLLNTLDSHAFSLLTSISLSGSRSRLKDLWIFIGSAQESSQESPLSGSSMEISPILSTKARVTSPVDSLSTSQSSEFSHLRSGSLPSTYATSQSIHQAATHIRSASNPAPHGLRHGRDTHSVLRKKGSRTYGDNSPPSSGNSPPRVSSEENNRPRHNVVNYSENMDMTGIGSAQRHASLARFPVGDPMQGSEPDVQRQSLPPNDSYLASHDNYDDMEGRYEEGELFYVTPPNDQRQADLKSGDIFIDPMSTSNSESSAGTSGEGSTPTLTPRDGAEPPRDVPQSVYDPSARESMDDMTPPILSPETFRDSAFSSTTGHSYEVPIAWTGGVEESNSKAMQSSPFLPSPPSSPGAVHDQSSEGETPTLTRKAFARHSTPLGFPGAWQPTPIEEGTEEQMGLHENTEPEDKAGTDPHYMPERKEVDAARFASPTFANSPAATRKSEVALYDMAPKRSISRSIPERPTASSGSPATGSGWVLVNVEHANRDSQGGQSTSSSRRQRSRSESSKPSSPPRLSPEPRSDSPPTQQEFSMSPVAKVIAAADAVSSVPVEPTTENPPSGGLLRFFKTPKVKSRRLTPSGRVVKVKALEREELEQREKKKGRKLSIRERLRVGSTDEPSS